MFGLTFITAYTSLPRMLPSIASATGS